MGWVHPNGENSASQPWLGCREYLLGAGFLYNYTVAKNIFTYIPILFFCVVNAAKSGVLKLAGNDGDIQTLTVTFEILLSFATGAPRPPPAGNKPMPTLAFEDQRSPFPRANTCSNTLYLSIAKPLPSPEVFAYNMAYGMHVSTHSLQ